MQKTFNQVAKIGYYTDALAANLARSDIAEGRIPENPQEAWFRPFDPEHGNDRRLVGGVVVQEIQSAFQSLAEAVTSGSLTIAETDAARLRSSLSQMERMLNLPDPAPGYTTHFSNIQRPLKEAMPQIRAAAEKMGIEAPEPATP